MSGRLRHVMYASLVALLAVACSQSDPRIPPESAEANAVRGVVWFDDGNQSIDSGERPGINLEVKLGFESTTIGEPVATDERGGFVIPLPELESLANADLFVHVSFPVDGPSDDPTSHNFRQLIVSNQPVAIALPDISRCLIEVDLALADPQLCGSALLPDLVPLVADFDQPPDQTVATQSVVIDSRTRPGSVLLRFSSATANLGAGPLHMIPEPDPADNSLPTWQRIWTDTNRFVDHRSGEFVFHPGHDHFHLSAFEQYRLLTSDGQVRAQGEKISFCLIDSLRAVPGDPPLGFGVFPEVACQEAAEQQALNPGWADYYDASLDDQWIDITGVAPGDYLVEIVVDPDDLLIESNEGNNRATFPVTIPDQAG